MTHSNLIFDRTPLKDRYEYVHTVYSDQPFCERNHGSLSGVLAGICIFGLGFFLSIPVFDALWEGRFGILQIGGALLCIGMFALSQFLLIWDLAWLVA